MMHPLLIASIVGAVGVGVIVYAVYTTLQEPQYVHVDGKSEKRHELPLEDHSDEEDSSSDENKSGLRRRKKSKGSIGQRTSSNDYDEQELLDKLSYLNAVEQEIERKKIQLANEERILDEKEREIEQRKQTLLSSSRSSSIYELRNLSSDSTLQNPTEIHNEQPLIEISSPTSLNPHIPPPPSIKTVNSSLNDEHDNESHTFSDTAAHTILTQDLSHISHQQMTPVANYPLTMNHPSNSTISSQHDQEGQDGATNQPPNQSCLTAKSARSEDAWSEIESILSENIGSIMSSAVDIDMEDIDVIEH